MGGGKCLCQGKGKGANQPKRVDVMVSRAGLELVRVIEPMQLIDFHKRQNLEERCLRRIEVHNGYTSPVGAIGGGGV